MKRGAVCLLVTVALAVVSCGGGSDGDTVLVMAASSLTDAFEQLEAAFEAANPDLDVQLNLAGSASLREQILQGAPADVFASANETTMQAVIAGGAATSHEAFARNRLQLAVPRDNEAGVTGIEDLENPDLLVGLCAADVPCGDFARAALAQAGITASIDTNEADARALRTKIAAGELDAGIIYVTDVLASDEVIGFELPAAAAVDIVYPLAVLTDAPNGAGAARFVDFALSPAGQEILASHGFSAP